MWVATARKNEDGKWEPQALTEYTNNNLALFEFKRVIFFKGEVHPKMKIYLKFTHPQTIQDVDEFVSLLEQI